MIANVQNTLKNTGKSTLGAYLIFNNLIIAQIKTQKLNTTVVIKM